MKLASAALLLLLPPGQAGAWPRRSPLPGPAPELWTAKEAFPGQSFRIPIGVFPDPGDPDRLFVLERGGTVQALRRRDGVWRNGPAPFLDISSRTYQGSWEAGLLGFAAHPEFGRPGSPRRGSFYVFYTARAGSAVYDRLSRFTVPDGSDSADPGSEEVLIDQLDEHDTHNAGGLAFGPDGFLYVALGDEGQPKGAADNAQRVDKDLFSGILRLDVERRGGDVSHPPPRQPETGRTAGYFIPGDNPFVGVPGALEEFWSLGLRNPFRISFDAQTGKLWVADVGEDHWESVLVAGKGSNHGWNYEEGGRPFPHSPLAGPGRTPATRPGAPTAPVYAYGHAQGRNCVLGGFVYRGRRFPELRGKYLFGDWGSGRVMAIPAHGRPVAEEELVEIAAPTADRAGLLVALSEGADGEVYLFMSPGLPAILELARPEPRRPNFARKLSRTGLFKDIRTLEPAEGFLPYEVNVPFWSEGSEKRRWLRLPEASRIGFDPMEPWGFPVGSTFLKHFELPGSRRKLETRVLVRTADGVRGAAYLWDEDGSEARLVERAAEAEAGSHRWRVPGPADCRQCHNRMAGYVLGVNARQLNRDTCSAAGCGNQLERMSREGLFDREVSSAGLTRLIALSEEGAPEQERVRSYLDANCAQCHRSPPVRGFFDFDARFQTPWERQGLLEAAPIRVFGSQDLRLVKAGRPDLSILYLRMSGGFPDLDQKLRMPPLGSGVKDEEALRLLERWIRSLPPRRP